MARFIINAPRWLLLVALVYAPWAYGSTRPWAISGLDGLLGAVLVSWLLSYLLRQQWPSVHPVLGVAALGLVAQAWFMVVNAKYEYDTQVHEFITLTPLLSWAPGSLHRALSQENATQLSAMLVAVCVVCEISRSWLWRKRLLLTMALAGTSVVVLGLAQKFTNASAVFWGSEDMGKTFFATWRYHANAGAFMNLVWPIVASFAALTFLRKSTAWQKVCWTAALVFCLAGVMANTSRAAGALGLLSAGLWGGWLVYQMVRGRFSGFSPATTTVTALLLISLVISVAALAGLDTTLKRWSQIGDQVTADNSRLLAAEVCLDMAPKAGAWGFGPGTFRTAFPYFTQGYGKSIEGTWLYAHEDYLQTLVEWGWVGASLWAVVMFGGLVSSLARAFRHRQKLSSSVRVSHFALIVGLLGVLLHALVDFPLQIASIQLYVAVVVGLLWGSRHWLSAPKTERRSRSTAGRDAFHRVPLFSS